MQNVQQPRPLEYAAMDDLVAELKARHRAILVVTDSEVPGQPHNTETRVCYGGSWIQARGLVEYARDALKASPEPEV